ncbi:hypothetical protein BCR33DRAFT_564558 [Rhizoclosmatium globosum]|uniref:Uncharacterized protein n=1 Tax=Rhizoclosmatium globosum TaxID=329046 RepID=A0A1Y2B764_9FUNG|nr:hypothetical protein BCR33DRAFT_564558 [Rhizoclosmatium globosum]|eukprot:ORY30683.1 hypothetical protein BCR33DRAFT_564558 [Rhizoclosmatium globosum]
MYDVISGKSMNISAGKVGRKVSKELEKKLTSHPATMFAAELYMMHKKNNIGTATMLDASNQLDISSLRARVRAGMLERINHELTRLNRKQFTVVQLSKLLRPEGFHGVRLEGFGFTPKQFGSLRTTACATILKELKIPGKIRLVLVKPPEDDSDSNKENTAEDDDGNSNDEDINAIDENEGAIEEDGNINAIDDNEDEIEGDQDDAIEEDNKSVEDAKNNESAPNDVEDNGDVENEENL